MNVISRLLSGPNSKTQKQLVSSMSDAYRFQIGAIRATAVSDGQMLVPVAPIYSAFAAKSEVSAALVASGLDSEIVELGLNLLVLELNSRKILIDTGCGGLAFYGDNGHGMARLKSAGISPVEITDVILTHLHPDHVGGMGDLQQRRLLFPNARHYVSDIESAYWNSDHPDMSRQGLNEEGKQVFRDVAHQALSLLGDRVVRVKNGQRIGECIEVISAPGHTPGHIILRISSGHDQLIHLGDTIHHPAIQMAHPNWSSEVDSDPSLAERTRRQVLSSVSSEQSLAFAYHARYPGLGRVTTMNEGFVWLPVDEGAITQW